MVGKASGGVINIQPDIVFRGGGQYRNIDIYFTDSQFRTVVPSANYIVTVDDSSGIKYEFDDTNNKIVLYQLNNLFKMYTATIESKLTGKYYIFKMGSINVGEGVMMIGEATRFEIFDD